MVVGEALIDIVVPYGRPDQAEEHVGGSPTNVAIGLARLGHEVQLVTHIGQDTRGQTIAALLANNGVTLSPGSTTSSHTPTGTAFLDAAGHATYDFDFLFDLEPDVDVPPGIHLHTGSIGAFVTPGGPKVCDLAIRAHERSTVSYDPNVRPSLMGDVTDARPHIEAFVGAADVVKASDEDLAWLYPETPADHVMAAWAARGPAVVVCTRGAHDPLVWLAGAIHTVPARPVDVVDTVGAGDTFMSGMISGLLDAGLLGGAAARARLRAATWDDIRPAITRAVEAAAVDCMRAGANPPTRAELP